MTLARFLKPYTATGLLRQFGTLSLIVIALITIALSLVISYFLRKDLLEREWRLTADYIWVEIVRQLTQTDFDAPMTKQAQEHFKKVYDVTVMMPEIVRVKIYDAAMTVAWSDEARLIGQRFPDNRELVRALHGEVAVNLKTQAKAETIYERQDSGRLVEVYVPIIFPGTTRVAGVVETYKLPEQVFANIRRAQLVVAGTALAGGIVLYLSLFSIVRLVARRLESQRALTARLQVTREEERASVAHQAREQLA
jgi:two-component system, NtrC family, sensor histidine kinase HydH